ncbi:DUF1232 domain-containing protein [Microbacterium maritypicum]|jgi:uncharacterized membrane protein YkvA (DUF1232 family)|uniref:YkvA family protein n=1 Tax=Microbacterium TaxID=33882 RepID=UPI0011BB9C4B|nr:DUF1232 domain-containing protein [Microbacterium sp. CBA3102]QEA29859.1 DUF1232 domain-containing protein [Microbacterium sp. CBA3102]
MPDWLVGVAGVIGGLVLLWVALVVFLLVQQRRAGNDVDWRDIARLAPDIVRLIKRLATDTRVPRGTRAWLVALMIYLVLPIDLIPDFIPVIGYADDAIIVAVALRYAVRHAGLVAIERNWPGTPAGLRSVLVLVGLADA